MSEQAQSVLLVSRPEGAARPENFRVVTHPVPEPGEGEFLVRILYLSLDPYMRGRMDETPSYVPPAALGEKMPGGCVGEVVVSRHPDFAPGQHVMGYFGWTSHAVSDGTGVHRVDPAAAPLSAYLGALGMPGHTAWVSLERIACGRPGETILVSAATGAVGSVLGQLARAKGLTVIGTAGGPEKCRLAVEAFGYAACIDHRAARDAADLAARLAEAAPDGIDIYHDNVAGRTLEAALACLRDHGRIALCGTIAWRGGERRDDAMPLPALWRTILVKRLTVRGMIVFDHADSYPDFVAAVTPLVASGALVIRETIADGLAAAPEAFLSMLSGGNVGKQLVRVAPA
jgi:NADPH-dependent curcumin reductase CurA